jgi:hypothetical protein
MLKPKVLVVLAVTILVARVSCKKKPQVAGADTYVYISENQDSANSVQVSTLRVKLNECQQKIQDNNYSQMLQCNEKITEEVNSCNVKIQAAIDQYTSSFQTPPHHHRGPGRHHHDHKRHGHGHHHRHHDHERRHWH